MIYLHVLFQKGRQKYQRGGKGGWNRRGKAAMFKIEEKRRQKGERLIVASKGRRKYKIEDKSFSSMTKIQKQER